MRLFFDTEFTGLHKDTTLISLGIVAENGKKFYAEFLDFNWSQVDEWIQENVINHFVLDKFFLKDPIENIEKQHDEWEKKGYVVSKLPTSGTCAEVIFPTMLLKDGNMEVVGETEWIVAALKDWLSQFDSIQFVSDVCHYDFVLLIDLFGTSFDLPENVCAACHDINQDIARRYGISEREAFDKSREEIVSELCGHEIKGRKHNALYDAEVIKAIYEEIA